MKKILKIIFLCFILCFCFCISAFADDGYYNEQYKNSGIPSLEEYLNQDAKEILDELDIDADNPQFYESISAKNIFSHIFTFIKSGLKDFKWAVVSLLFICVISAAAGIFCDDKPLNNTLNYVYALSVCTCTLVPIFSHINTVVNAIKAGSVFMLSFVPMYSSFALLGSSKLTELGSSATLLFAAEAVSMLSSFVILPLLCGYLAMGICSSVSTLPFAANLCKGVKKAMIWIMSLIFTVFLGVIGIQSTLLSAAENLGTKTAKFMLNSSVPLVGGVLSESLATVIAGVKLLRSSASIYAIIALAAIILPPLLQTLMWQLVIKVSDIVTDMFSLSGAKKVLLPVADALSLVSGILLFVFALFVISLSVITVNSGGGGV